MPHSPLDRRQIAADAERMKAIAAGDTRTLQTVMREETVRLAVLGMSLLTDRAEVEELLQEAFLRLWQQAPDWRPEARLSTWLHRVVYRLAIDRLRQRRPSLDIDEIAGSLPGETVSPEEALWQHQRGAMIDWALEQLAPSQAAAITLAYRQGLSQVEASTVLGVSEAAYESLLARGRRRLKALIATQGVAKHDGE
jgi:RNA polymerase sigma-70 factor, ECF subfamily